VPKNEERYLLQALEFEGVLRACLYRHTRSEAEVEDLLQETYARLLAAAAADTPEVPSVRAFALGIARTVAREWLRERQIVPVELAAELETLEVSDQDGQVEEIVRRRQELARLLSAIQSLPESCRQVFTLRKVYGYSPAQIASRLGIPDDQVGEQLTHALRRCAQVVFAPPPVEPRATLFDRFRGRKRA
jgi:RNA polymerase sigma factor (sigma-70 family)